MANSIALVTKFLPLLDEVYRLESKSARFDAQTGLVLPTQDAKSIKIAKIAMQGLVDYARETGFTRGDVTLDWETFTFSNDRGRTFHIDRLDDEETLGIVMGSVVGEFIRTKVVPEIDAYRFAKYAGTAGVGVATDAVITAANIVDEIDKAIAVQDDGEVPTEGRVLLMSPKAYAALKKANDTKHFLVPGQSENRNFMSYDDMEIVKVPQGRFFTAITMNTTGDGGYIKNATTGKDINFMVVHPTALLQVTKHAIPRMFDPNTNQSADAWKIDYRIYHDAFVYDNKKAGIYVHAAPKA